MKYNRKKFLASIGSAATGTILLNTLLPASVYGQVKPVLSNPGDNEYLFSEGLIYLNTGTIGPCRRETIEESLKMWQELESMPVKFYGGQGAQALAEKTRTIAAKFLGCDLTEIVITTSTTNGMNAIVQGLRLKPGDHVLVTNQEHGGGIECWEYYAKYHDVIVDKVSITPTDTTGSILQKINDGIKKETKAISASHVFSSTGLRMPIAEISALARTKNILSIVDGAQAVGAINVNVKELGCHAYATSGHKWLMGPKGTGLLFISKDARDLIRPMQYEKTFNTYGGNGVVNLACILGLGKAIEYLESIGISEVEKHNLALRNRLYEKIQEIKEVKIMSPANGPLASPMLALLLPERHDKNAFVKMLLDKYKVSIRPTHKEFGFNGIRFSMHVFNTEKEVDFAGELLQKELG